MQVFLLKKIIYYISVISIVVLSFYMNYYFKIKVTIPQENILYSTNLHKETFEIKANTSEDNLELHSTSAVLIDADTNRILYSKNADKEMEIGRAHV